MFGHKVVHIKTGETGFICSHDVSFNHDPVDALVIVVWSGDDYRYEAVRISDLKAFRYEDEEDEEEKGGGTVLSLVPASDDETIN